MTSLHGKNYFTSTAQQTTNLATTNSTKLGDFPLVLPPLTVQQEIIGYLDQETTHINSLVETIQEQIEKLGIYRQALITAAVTGKIDVRGATIQADMEG